MLLIFTQIFNFLISVAVSAPTVYDQRQTGASNVRVDIKDAVLIAIGDELGDYEYNYDYSDLTIKPEVPSTTSRPLIAKPEVPSSTSGPLAGKPEVPSSTSGPLAGKPEVPSTTSRPVTVVSEYSSTTSRPITTSSGTPASQSQNISIIIDSNNNTLVFLKPGNETSILHNALKNQDHHIPVLVAEQVKEKKKLLPVKIVGKSESTRTNASDEIIELRHCSQGFFLDSQNRCRRLRKPARKQD